MPTNCRDCQDETLQAFVQRHKKYCHVVSDNHLIIEGSGIDSSAADDVAAIDELSWHCWLHVHARLRGRRIQANLRRKRGKESCLGAVMAVNWSRGPGNQYLGTLRTHLAVQPNEGQLLVSAVRSRWAEDDFRSRVKSCNLSSQLALQYFGLESQSTAKTTARSTATSKCSSAIQDVSRASESCVHLQLSRSCSSGCLACDGRRDRASARVRVSVTRGLPTSYIPDDIHGRVVFNDDYEQASLATDHLLPCSPCHGYNYSWAAVTGSTD